LLRRTGVGACHVDFARKPGHSRRGNVRRVLLVRVDEGEALVLFVKVHLGPEFAASLVEQDVVGGLQGTPANGDLPHDGVLDRGCVLSRGAMLGLHFEIDGRVVS
jgi:hypothetical protein